MLTHVGLVFRLNYLFLACFSNLLACFCKITWHHCFSSKSYAYSSQGQRVEKIKAETSFNVLHVFYSQVQPAVFYIAHGQSVCQFRRECRSKKIKLCG